MGPRSNDAAVKKDAQIKIRHEEYADAVIVKDASIEVAAHLSLWPFSTTFRVVTTPTRKKPASRSDDILTQTVTRNTPSKRKWPPSTEEEDQARKIVGRDGVSCRKICSAEGLQK
jgi:hypothetical protein